ncbi:MAG: hypothetical protein IJY42_04635 [Clostridia bacterium]|nr:hypothetical protein [Clostridia bacterium]
MAVEMNDSYRRCIEELRARYQGRGVASNMRNEIARRAEKEGSDVNGAAQSRVLFDSRSGIGDLYRSGEYMGSKYMTSADFVRYFKSRRAFLCPTVPTAAEAEAAANKAVPQRRTNGSEKGGLTRSESGSKEGHIEGVWSAVKELAKKWFPKEPVEGRTKLPIKRIPVTVLSTMAVFTLSLGLIVGGSVMVGNASGELGDVNSRIATLEAEQADLQGKLDLKYDINEIEAEATAMGMIPSQYADNRYLQLESEEVVVAEESEEEISFSALLSAFGIKLD